MPFYDSLYRTLLKYCKIIVTHSAHTHIHTQTRVCAISIEYNDSFNRIIFVIILNLHSFVFFFFFLTSKDVKYSSDIDHYYIRKVNKLNRLLNNVLFLNLRIINVITVTPNASWFSSTAEIITQKKSRPNVGHAINQEYQPWVRGQLLNSKLCQFIL